VDVQIRALETALANSPVTRAILERLEPVLLPSWYLGAGGVAHTVWNQLHGFDATRGIKDYDVVYFDPDDLTAEGEREVERRILELCSDLGLRLDVTNEARVHLWYEHRFGRRIAPYQSSEHAISTWPTTASSIGVRRHAGSLVVCAPYGLSDLLAMIVRPNKTLVDRSVYEEKVERWTKIWPRLTVLPWETPG
jgi:hypothetical protein